METTAKPPKKKIRTAKKRPDGEWVSANYNLKTPTKQKDLLTQDLRNRMPGLATKTRALFFVLGLPPGTTHWHMFIIGI